MKKLEGTDLFISRYELLKMFFKEHQTYIIDDFTIGKLASYIIQIESGKFDSVANKTIEPTDSKVTISSYYQDPDSHL